MEKDTEFDLISLLLIIVKRKKFIFLFTLIASIGAVIFSLLTTQKWSSEALVQPLTMSSSFDLAGLGGSLLGSLGSSISTGENAMEGERLVSIVNSRPFMEKVIAKFDLYTYYKVKKKLPFEVKRDWTIKKIKSKMLFVDFKEETGFLLVSVTTKDKYLSAKIANYIMSELDRYNKSERLTKAKESRIILEKRLTYIQKSIAENQELLAQFESKHSVLDLEAQAKSVVTEYVDLSIEKKKKEIAIQLMSLHVSDSDQRLKILKEEVNLLNKAIIKMEGYNKDEKFILALDDIPNLMKEYVALKAKLNIDKQVYEFLYPQYELTRLEESKESTTLNIIEDAVPAGKRAWPKRALLCISIFFTSLITSILYILLLELYSYKLSKNPELKNRINQLKHAFFNKS